MRQMRAEILAAGFAIAAVPALAATQIEIPVKLHQRVSPLEARAHGLTHRGSAEVPKRPSAHVMDPLKYVEYKSRAWTAEGLPAARALSQDVPEPLLSPRAPKRKKAWDGIDQFLGGESFPPDTNIAASESKVLEAVNVMLSLTDRSGRSEVLQSLSGHFFTGDSLFDPKVYFDRLSHRFFIVALAYDDRPRSSSIYLSVSRSGDPDSLDSAAWCQYEINARQGSSWADYPGLGMNDTWVGIGVNNFTYSGNFKVSYVYALAKEELVDNAEGCAGNLDVYKIKVKKDPDKVIAFNVEPAQHYSSEPGGPLYFVSSQIVRDSSDTYAIWRLEGDGSGKPSFKGETVEALEEYSYPPYATQGDGRFEADTGDPRILQVAYRDGALWAVQTTGCSIGSLPNESCVRAVQFDPLGNDTDIVFAETYGGGEGWYYFWPGIGINGRGDVATAFQASSDRDYVGIYYNGKKASQSGFDKVMSLEDGACGLSGNNYSNAIDAIRTGDYVGVQADPGDDKGFWIAGEYAGIVKASCGWRTYVARVTY